jgi:hypothetical protein
MSSGARIAGGFNPQSGGGFARWSLQSRIIDCAYKGIVDASNCIPARPAKADLSLTPLQVPDGTAPSRKRPHAGKPPNLAVLEVPKSGFEEKPIKDPEFSNHFDASGNAIDPAIALAVARDRMIRAQGPFKKRSIEDLQRDAEDRAMETCMRRENPRERLRCIHGMLEVVRRGLCDYMNCALASRGEPRPPHLVAVWTILSKASGVPPACDLFVCDMMHHISLCITREARRREFVDQFRITCKKIWNIATKITGPILNSLDSSSNKDDARRTVQTFARIGHLPPDTETPVTFAVAVEVACADHAERLGLRAFKGDIPTCSVMDLHNALLFLMDWCTMGGLVDA